MVYMGGSYYKIPKAIFYLLRGTIISAVLDPTSRRLASLPSSLPTGTPVGSVRLFVKSKIRNDLGLLGRGRGGGGGGGLGWVAS